MISDISTPVALSPSYIAPFITIDYSGSYRIGNLAIINMNITSISAIPSNTPMLQFNMKFKTHTSMPNNTGLSPLAFSSTGEVLPVLLYKIDENEVGILLDSHTLGSGVRFYIHGLVVCDI